MAAYHNARVTSPFRLGVPVLKFHCNLEPGNGIISIELAFGGSMDWTTPSFEEINLNCEISSYANAEL